MPIATQRVPPALKHGAYSEAALLPGEDPDEFKRLHKDLIADFRPKGRMEEETVASIARLVWRRQNLAHFELGQLSFLIVEGLKRAVADEKWDRRRDDEILSEFKKLVEARESADSAARNAGGILKGEAAGDLLVTSKVATLNRLMKELDLEERLDAMIDRLIKRLLFVRGVKSIMSSRDAIPPSSASKRLRAI